MLSSSTWNCSWSTETVMEFNTFLSKLVTMGSDGASVMLCLKNNNVHCYKDAMEKVPMAEKVLTLHVSQLWAGRPVIPGLFSCWPESDPACVCVGLLWRLGPLW